MRPLREAVVVAMGSSNAMWQTAAEHAAIGKLNSAFVNRSYMGREAVQHGERTDGTGLLLVYMRNGAKILRKFGLFSVEF